MNDPNLEDISIIGAGNMYIIHKAFGTLKVPVFLSVEAIDELIISLSEQFGKTISHAQPVVDAVFQMVQELTLYLEKISVEKELMQQLENLLVRHYQLFKFCHQEL